MIAVIVPAYNAEATLSDCLAAILAMTFRADEVIVFNDGSLDRTEEFARAAGVSVIRSGAPPKGPAHGRNVAAAAAKADLLLFVDADVVVAPDALERLVDDMLRHGAQAAFGSYDDSPRSQRAASLYANLRHHFVHQHGARQAATFWSGLGLVDRRMFLQLGGFDEGLFPYPSVEDIEFGARLIAEGGRIRLVPEAQGKHCKDWSLASVWTTDILRRAYPWSCLLADGCAAGADLNLRPAEKLSALVAVGVLGMLFADLAVPAALAGAALLMLLYLYLNRAFFGFLARRVSPPVLAQAIWMHWCYHLYATATYAWVMVSGWVGLRRSTRGRPNPALVQGVAGTR
jgi:GT2 family glycosyltransferase